MNGQPERFLRADAVARAFRARDVRVSTRVRRRAMESGREKSFGRDKHRARVRVTSRARESSENQSINHRVPFVPSQHFRYFDILHIRGRVRVRRRRRPAREVNEGEKK
tara:strand:- start:823 stop:1149 length:327 start_codon:yes stop_codon:yes gene_type:complete